ncbi:MAG: transcriptional antiterminator, BglG [Firmicutes bacterium]|nr:transcriptional antiterminator, BglG [Bacillota bacterium]
MIIKKILNNNVVITDNKNGQEVVAMGKGIAFKKRCGESVPEDAIDKIYTLSNHDILERLKTLLVDLSPEYMEISDEIIAMAENKLQKQLNENIYISLTDHIHMAIRRFRDGTFQRNMMIWEIKRFYPEEYAIGEEALKLINVKFGLEIPADEAGFVALHIIDAQMDGDRPLADRIMHLIQEITNIVRYTYSVEFDVESLQYYRFVTHLKFFAKRMFIERSFSNEVDEEMESFVQKKYKMAHLCVQKIAEFLLQQYQYEITADEKFYLMIHITKVTSKK